MAIGDYLNLFSHPKWIPLLTTMDVPGSERLLPTPCCHPGCGINFAEYCLVYLDRQTSQKDVAQCFPFATVLYKPYNMAIHGTYPKRKRTYRCQDNKTSHG